MPSDDVDVVVVGAGAAGIAAARRLHDAGVGCLLVEARPRLGGRALTVIDESGFALDLGCGWLHSADRNPWCDIARAQGASIDKSPPAWTRPSLEFGFSRAEQEEFGEAMGSFFARLERVAQNQTDVPSSAALEPGCRWNGLINALSTYISGAEWDQVSAKDFDRYADSGVNWRAIEGLGAVIRNYGADLPVTLGCRVIGIDHRDKRLRVETEQGAIAADQVIIAIPTSLLAREQLTFMPGLPQKIEAAQGLPLGLDDKLFMALDRAEEFDSDVRLFGHTDRAATGAYQFRPLGRPQIEAYFGDKLAAELEASGDDAFFDFAVSELTGLLGSDFSRRVKPIQIHRWGLDPFSLGSYSYALPGFADCRRALAEPIDDRLFFAGEACSVGDFSTAHGAWQTGVTAADQVLAARKSPVRIQSASV
jgi:monoamine oxidase